MEADKLIKLFSELVPKGGGWQRPDWWLRGQYAASTGRHNARRSLGYAPTVLGKLNINKTTAPEPSFLICQSWRCTLLLALQLQADGQQAVVVAGADAAAHLLHQRAGDG